jgi:prepilin-type N-terminal cleavage/methylation domain-containing protein
MFKLLKSKKGFTLVELMIVVVIMAILVAVAVPIFSAVTSNARKKTCAANQREIQSQFNNADMGGILSFTDGEEFTLTTVGKGDSGTWGGDATKLGEIQKLFQKVPFCPEEGAVITVTVTEVTIGASEDSGLKVTTACSIAGHEGGPTN